MASWESQTKHSREALHLLWKMLPRFQSEASAKQYFMRFWIDLFAGPLEEIWIFFWLWHESNLGWACLLSWSCICTWPATGVCHCMIYFSEQKLWSWCFTVKPWNGGMASGWEQQLHSPCAPLYRRGGGLGGFASPVWESTFKFNSFLGNPWV